MKRISLAVLCLFALVLNVVAYDSVDELVDDFETRKVSALDAYISEHPDAEDLYDALVTKANILRRPGREADAVPVLERMYEILSESENPRVDQLVGQVVTPLVRGYLATGEKDKARALIEKVKEGLSEKEASSRAGKGLARLEGMLNLPSVGEPMEIEFTGLDGEEVSLAKLADAGKVVLVDFWATWCGPCVAELPNVQKAYKKYHDKGFEIVGISLDKDKSRFDAFIKDNDMPWPQHFDGKGWQNEISTSFGIQSIPATFLVGKDGKVVRTDLRGSALEDALAGLLD